MLISFATLLIGLVGIGLLCTGAWLIYPPSAFLVGGVCCLFWSYSWARSVAVQPGGKDS